MWHRSDPLPQRQKVGLAGVVVPHQEETDGEQGVGQQGEHEQDEEEVKTSDVVLPHAVADPRTVVVVLRDADPTHETVPLPGLSDPDAGHAELTDLVLLSEAFVRLLWLPSYRTTRQGKKQPEDNQEDCSQSALQPQRVHRDSSKGQESRSHPQEAKAGRLSGRARLRLVFDLRVTHKLKSIHAGVAVVEHGNDPIELVLPCDVEGSQSPEVASAPSRPCQQQLLDDGAVAVGGSQVEGSVSVPVLLVVANARLGQQVLNCFVAAAEGCPVQRGASSVVSGVEGQARRVQHQDGRGPVALSSKVEHAHAHSISSQHVSLVLLQGAKDVSMATVACEVNGSVALLVLGVKEQLGVALDLGDLEPAVLELLAVVGEVEGEELVLVVVGTVVDHSALLVVAHQHQVYPPLPALEKGLDVLKGPPRKEELLLVLVPGHKHYKERAAAVDAGRPEEDRADLLPAQPRSAPEAPAAGPEHHRQRSPQRQPALSPATGQLPPPAPHRHQQPHHGPQAAGNSPKRTRGVRKGRLLALSPLTAPQAQGTESFQAVGGHHRKSAHLQPNPQGQAQDCFTGPTSPSPSPQPLSHDPQQSPPPRLPQARPNAPPQ